MDAKKGVGKFQAFIDLLQNPIKRFCQKDALLFTATEHFYRKQDYCSLLLNTFTRFGIIVHYR